MIGARTRRVEDPSLLRGTGRFVSDINHPGQVHMRVVRSPSAAGRIAAIHVEAALEMPGVRAVWTAEDTADLGPIEFRLNAAEPMLPYRQPVLARNFVRYVGEPVAAVFADSPYSAEDAADLVEVDIRDTSALLAADADIETWPGVFDSHGRQAGCEALLDEIEYGQVDQAFTQAYRIVDVDVTIGRHTAVPLECRGVVARVDETTGSLIVEGAAKVPFWNKDAIARTIGLPPSSVILREGDVGGGFGVRGELYPEDVIVCLAAVRLGVPVKWIEDRQEHLVAANHSRDQHHRLRGAVDEMGVLTALDGEIWLDQGAYVRTHAATVPWLTASMLPGPYRVPSYRMRTHVRVTNKTPAGTYRSPGRYEGTVARERLMDAISAELRLGRLEVRVRNFIRAAEMPFARPMKAMGTDLVYDSGDYQLLLDRMEERWNLSSLEQAVAKRRAHGELAGIGYGCFVEKSGLGPAESARVTVDSDGSVVLVTGASSVGQGVDTVLTQVASDVLEIPMDRIRVVRGQTDQFEYGPGAFATRQSVMVGSATFRASMELRTKATEAAAHLLEVDPADLDYSGGTVRAVGVPSVHLSLADIAAAIREGRVGDDPDRSLVADGDFRTDHMAYPYGIHAAVVRVDPSTGAIRVERYLVGYDVGRALNPMLVEGQLVGGVAQGLGGAILEEFRYSDEGQPQCTTLIDYRLPTLLEVPRVEVLITEDAPSPLNPLGVKGAGEGGTNAVGATIASAVDDALSRPGAISRLPITPEQIVEALVSSHASSST